MKRRMIIGSAVAISLGMTTPALAQSAGEILKGTAIGAGGGAVVGAVVPGVSTGEGALIGAAGGAAITALSKKDRKWHRDKQGRRYYINRRGERVYR